MLAEIILGKDVYTMCSIIESKIPYNSDDGESVRRGLFRLINIFILLGICLGITSSILGYLTYLVLVKFIG